MTNDQLFTSKDFHKTRATLEANIPKKLVHKNVELQSLHKEFSKERNHPVFLIDLPSKNISMTIGGLNPKQVTRKHRHTYETILYVIEGNGWTEIEGKHIEWTAGDAVYIPSWAWHRHGNQSDIDSAKYIACENAPQLQNLGVALREEAPRNL